MDIDSWLGDEPEAQPAGPACGSGAVHAGDCELLEMTPADRDPLANTMSEAKQMIVGSTTMVGCIGVVNWWVGPSARPDNQILGRAHFLRAVTVVHILKVN